MVSQLHGYRIKAGLAVSARAMITSLAAVAT